MLSALLHATKQRFTVDRTPFPDLPADMKGLPKLSSQTCAGEGCSKCADACPMGAIEVSGDRVRIDRGQCIACGACIVGCPTKTIVAERSTMTAVRNREDLVISTDSPSAAPSDTPPSIGLFRRSVDVRVVSTGCSATDLEVNASLNPDFDGSRFGIRFVASPRFADVLLVTGPVPRAMQEPLLQCYQAMAEPRLVIAAGCSAICGGLHRNGYADARGVDPHLKVDVYIPGNPPHPIAISYGIVLATRAPKNQLGGGGR